MGKLLDFILAIPAILAVRLHAPVHVFSGFLGRPELKDAVSGLALAFEVFESAVNRWFRCMAVPMIVHAVAFVLCADVETTNRHCC